MAHTKAQKAAKGNRDSRSKRLGVKIFGNQKTAVGNVIVRQRGSTFKAGSGTKLGHDFTIYATQAGVVGFKMKQGRSYVVVNPA